jgi:hypothetical protein
MFKVATVDDAEHEQHAVFRALVTRVFPLA